MSAHIRIKIKLFATALYNIYFICTAEYYIFTCQKVTSRKWKHTFKTRHHPI